TNLADQPLTRGYVLFDNQKALDFTTVAPGERKTFKGPLKRTSKHNWNVTAQTMNASSFMGFGGGKTVNMKSDIRTNLSVATGFAQGTLPRSAGILRGLEQGKALVCVEYTDAPIDFTVANKTYDLDHICWCRMLVTPGLLNEELIDDPNKRPD
ncbi:MAG: hypothetical protein JW709_08605, partial [Sedimentisphaerales bacterium]|nr:hypothetical protein [Sedimentisphaerales bacterium]